ncbi:BQ5605_C030g10798 [Microbotryum silenes-dioicae]|uniref:BQ5605_C030g10798 protein n=1 Tax=Microbotryum silenes-dioicae TaxID=796604 RepID=A0A2X0MKN9_9BASI|nr:BQ5605_C030g10798 [Microbotryum silenes-dioicae]
MSFIVRFFLSFLVHPTASYAFTHHLNKMRSSLIILGLLAFTGFVVAQGIDDLSAQDPSLKRLKVVKREKTPCGYCTHHCSYEAAYGGSKPDHRESYIDCYNRLCRNSPDYDCPPSAK